MNATDLGFLHNKVVLVCSEADRRNPPTGRRGTLLVEQSAGRQVVSLEIEFPEMFTSRAHRHRVVLEDEQIEQLLRRGHYGAYTLTLPGRLDPDLAPGNE